MTYEAPIQYAVRQINVGAEALDRGYFDAVGYCLDAPEYLPAGSTGWDDIFEEPSTLLCHR